MEPFTLDRKFLKRDIVDGFISVIWTERYYGNGEVEMTVPATPSMIQKFPEGIFLGMDGSDEIMIIETADVQDDKLKLNGISLASWLNNRFVRTSPNHEDRYWYIEGHVPGYVMWIIVYNMCCVGSPYLDGTIPTGIPNPSRFAIPGLYLKAYDTQGDQIKVGVPYGPVYNALKEIATTFQVGMQITLDSASESSYSLGFRSYRGLDRTSGQTVNPQVRFSPQMDSLTNIKELRSIAALKTDAFAFAPSNPDGLATIAGVSTVAGPPYSGFDLRASLVFAEDVTTDMVGGDPDNLVSVLNSRADAELMANRVIKAVDGEIVPRSQFQYGAHYNLGDIVEIQGFSGIVQTARVTEYIRAQDSAGQKSYPTVEMIS